MRATVPHLCYMEASRRSRLETTMKDAFGTTYLSWLFGVAGRTVSLMLDRGDLPGKYLVPKYDDSESKFRRISRDSLAKYLDQERLLDQLAELQRDATVLVLAAPSVWAEDLGEKIRRHSRWMFRPEKRSEPWPFDDHESPHFQIDVHKLGSFTEQFEAGLYLATVKPTRVLVVRCVDKNPESEGIEKFIIDWWQLRAANELRRYEKLRAEGDLNGWWQFEAFPPRITIEVCAELQLELTLFILEDRMRSLKKSKTNDSEAEKADVSLA